MRRFVFVADELDAPLPIVHFVHGNSVSEQQIHEMLRGFDKYVMNATVRVAAGGS